MAACGTGRTPPRQLAERRRPAIHELGAIPQPGLATIDLGRRRPRLRRTGDFYSYDSDLSPEATIGAYAGQLLDAGYRDAGRLGSWRVFVGPVLTVWVRVGSGGPPTSLLVRVQPTTAADADTPDPTPPSATAAAPDRPPTATGGQVGSGGPKATSRPDVAAPTRSAARLERRDGRRIGAARSGDGRHRERRLVGDRRRAPATGGATATGGTA